MRTKNRTYRLPTEQEIQTELERTRYKTRYRRTLLSTIEVLITVAAASVLIAMLLLPVLQIHGSSMTPTLEDGQIVLALQRSEMKQGDLIAFYYGDKLLIKRCIAAPGQWVDIDEDGNVYVDSILLDEPYLQEKALGECDISLPYQVPDNRWFLMGDHRSVSLDSRSTQIGCISQEQILGTVVIRVWPLAELSSLR